MGNPPETIEQAVYYLERISDDMTADDDADLEMAFNKIMNVLNRHHMDW